ncbi:MAG: carbohydrate kinase family protein [Clostridia bacterium]|nr:carbohydrate kinase family protein [Clostridia bacterium]
MKKVACVGILVADVIVEPVNGIPEKGLLTHVNSITMHSGGNAMTASINLTKLGVDANVIGCVGNDIFGTFLIDCLNKAGVKTDGVKISDAVQTSSSIALIDGETKDRTFLHCVGTNGVFSIDDIDFSVIEKSDIVFVTGTFLLKTFDGKQTMEFLKKCKEMGKTTVLDVCWDASGRWGEVLDMSMPYIDIFMPSIDEARELAKKETPEEMADVFFKNGAGKVVIKCGSTGCFYKENKDAQGRMLPAYKIENPVDTTGAGDSFCSGFLAAYARDEQFEDCIKSGNATGAHCVMGKGATSGIPTYDVIKNFIKEREQ